LAIQEHQRHADQERDEAQAQGDDRGGGRRAQRFRQRHVPRGDRETRRRHQDQGQGQNQLGLESETPCQPAGFQPRFGQQLQDFRQQRQE
jgi:hypothetical protein